MSLRHPAQLSRDSQNNPWIERAVLTIAVLAVLAAFASLRGSFYNTKIQLATTQASNQWAYFQARNIRQHIIEMQRDLFVLQSVNSPSERQKEYIEAMLKKYTDEVNRYEKEKNGIKIKAEMVSKQEDQYKKHGNNFHLSVTFFQMAIMLSSVGALIKRRMLWAAGLCFGVLATVFFLNGFYLFF